MALLASEVEDNFIQVIEHLEDDKIRIYQIVSVNEPTDGDPLTTIEIKGYIEVDKEKS